MSSDNWKPKGAPKGDEQREETALRVAQIHRYASHVFSKIGKNVEAVDSNQLEADFVAAITQSIISFIAKDIKKSAEDDPGDLVFRLLACGMALQTLKNDKDKDVRALRRELKRLPNGFSGLLTDMQRIYKEGGEAEVLRLAESPLVQKIYAQLNKEMS